MPIDDQLAFATIPEIGKLYRRGRLSPVELTRFLLARIDRLNPHLNAFLTVSDDLALQQAASAESALSTAKGRKSRHDLGPLHGIPISFKDNIYTKNIRTTAGSKILRDFVPVHDAPVVAALKKSGVVILGKTNMHEFAYGITSENPHYGPVHNPWELARISGGSSGGSAAALAAGLCYGSIGTDTGGSIRVPASLCGVVGLKPGLRRVSMQEAIPLSRTLDFVGPMARTAEDAALLLEPIFLGKGERSLIPRKIASTRMPRKRFGIPTQFFSDLLSPEVQHAFERSLRILKKQGAQLKEISLPSLAEAEEAGNHIAWPESALYHQQAGWFPSRAAEYGEDVRTRLELGSTFPAVQYLKAIETRAKFIAAFHATLQENNLDALVLPTTPVTAPLIGESSLTVQGKSHPTRALLLRLNRPANLGAFPAISVPCGLSASRLPFGLQFIAAVTDERLLLEIARDFEHSFPLTDHPNLTFTNEQT
jgi:aspartyl-tRNA(Asn)/glutamyl-tRNA(Gln) amidotransferase subunit A